MTNINLEEPLDLIKLSLGEKVLVKCRNERELRGKLHSFDNHLNLLLSDVEERITRIEYDEKTKKEVQKVVKKFFGIIFVRGDLIILISPPQRG